MDYQESYNYAVKLLSKKDYSKYKLSKKLLDKGATQSDVDEVVATLEEKKWLREECYTEARIKSLLHKGLSVRFIQNTLELENLDISKDQILNVLEKSDVTEDEIILRLIEKKLHSSQANDQQGKLYSRICNYLSSKGHNYSDFNRLLSNRLKERSEDN